MLRRRVTEIKSVPWNYRDLYQCKHPSALECYL